MARPVKAGVDYFQHDTDASSKRTLFTLEATYGNDGYALFWKMLEIMGQQDGLYLDLKDDSMLLYLTSRARITEPMAEEMLTLLSRLGAIDKQLWEEEKIVWSQNFVDRLSILYDKRTNPLPDKPTPGKEDLVSPTNKVIDLVSPTNKVSGESYLPENPSYLSDNSPNTELPTRKPSNSGVISPKSTHSIGEYSIGEDSIDISRATLATEVLTYLNQRAGTAYRSSSKKTKALILARSKEGFSLDDFKAVIDKKSQEWKGTEWEKFIRPETLFGTKFESYLNQKDKTWSPKVIAHPQQMSSQEWYDHGRQKEDGSFDL